MSGGLHRIRLDVFLHCTLGGFVEPSKTRTRRETILALYRQGMHPKDIGERVQRSGNYVSQILCIMNEPPRFHKRAA